jgi:hypothetical protein
MFAFCDFAMTVLYQMFASWCVSRTKIFPVMFREMTSTRFVSFSHLKLERKERGGGIISAHRISSDFCNGRPLGTNRFRLPCKWHNRVLWWYFTRDAREEATFRRFRISSTSTVSSKVQRTTLPSSKEETQIFSQWERCFGWTSSPHVVFTRKIELSFRTCISRHVSSTHETQPGYESVHKWHPKRRVPFTSDFSFGSYRIWLFSATVSLLDSKGVPTKCSPLSSFIPTKPCRLSTHHAWRRAGQRVDPWIVKVFITQTVFVKSCL